MSGAFTKTGGLEILSHYTGMGLEGDQRLDPPKTKRWPSQQSNGVDVFLFEVFETGKYVFKGQVYLAGIPYARRATRQKWCHKKCVGLSPQAFR